MDTVAHQLLHFEKTLVGKRVLLTGHTGFTGSWACLWLHTLGAEIYGYALPPATTPALYTELKLDEAIHSQYGDINHYQSLEAFFTQVQPDLVLHLAAQPLVRYAYKEPILTFATNVLGTAHVLEAARKTPSVQAVLCITTDKVYQNHEWPWPYRENDRLGGKDPYSASKAAAEMVIDSYRTCFGDQATHSFAIATARGGNIIGGGDWSEDRLIPDFVRAMISDGTLTLRYPHATRPWQHVLALVQGYLMLLAGLLDDPKKYARAWNLGPRETTALSVGDVINILAKEWGSPTLNYMENPLAEAAILALDSSLARQQLHWNPVWEGQRLIAETAAWYREYYRTPSTIKSYSLQQLQTWRTALFEEAQVT
ncbi:MAG: CDP-glucose 4,6-dehydratase [Legionellales bacterium]|nr:CDP-glucose 4,6-dehydratase [Legionellales bacterium]